MRYLRQNTAVIVSVGPFYDKTDGVTIETGLTITNERITLVADTDDGNAPTNILDNVTGATSGTSNDLNYITGNDAGMMQLELSAANTNRVGRLLLSITDAANHVPVFHEFTLLPANVYDSLMGTDLLDVNTAQWLGTACATPTVAGVPEVDPTHWNGTAVATPDTAGYPKITVKSGAGTGEISLSSGGVSLSTSGLGAAADSIWDEDITTHRTANSAGAMQQPIRSAACQAGGDTTHVILDASASSVTDAYKYQVIEGWVTSDGSNKFAAIISAYNGTTKSATVNTIPYSPDATYTYVIRPFGSVPGASAPTAAEVADAVWDEAASGHVSAGTFGQYAGGEVTRAGTAQAGTTSSITLDASASAVDHLYKYHRVEIIGGTGVGEVSYVTAYVGSSKVASVDPAFAVAPAADSIFILRKTGLDAATPAIVADAVWDEARASHAAAGSFGEYVFADATRLSGDATAADNLEAMVDGTGLTLTGVTVPTVTTVGTVTTLTGHTAQTGDAYARLGAPAGASVSADIAAVKSDSAAILVDTGTTLDTALATVDTVVDAIKAKTDSLTFTQAGHVDANVQRINDVVVNGDGSATPWGP